MKIIKLIACFILLGINGQAMAAQTDWNDGDTGLAVKTALKANDTEIYNILSGTAPTLGHLEIGGTGDSWLEMDNNTSLVDDYTGVYGVRFYNGVLQQIINGTASSIGSGGSSVTYQTSDPDDTDETGFYLNTTDGDFFHVSQNVGVSTWSTVFTPSAVIPEYSSGSILAVGNIIEMTFDNNLAEGVNWSNTGLFTVDGSVTGADIAVTTTDITGAVITGTLASVIEQDETTTVSFAGGANVLEGADGSDVLAFTDVAVTNQSTQTPVSSLVDEDFNVVGYSDPTWTQIGTPDTLDPDSTLGVAPLEGTYSLYIDASSSGSNQGITKTFTATSDLHIKTTINMQLITDDGSTLILLQDSIAGSVAAVTLGLDGTLSASVPGTFTTLLATASTDTDYYIWIDIAGTNDTTVNDIDFFISTTNLKPGTPTVTTTSTGTTDAEKISLLGSNITQIFYDKVGVSEDIL